MSREKQIEEMARIFAEGDGLRRCWDEVCETCKFFSVDENYCRDCFGATALHDAGYRKQEWISVKDDTPKDGEKRVQVFLRDDAFTKPIGSNKIDTDRYIDGKWVRWGKHVTHWMELPAPPKGVRT